MKNFIIIITLATLLFGCKKETLSVMDSNQKVYFQYQYLNYAWSYQNKGWIIDSTGNVYTFDKPDNWNFVDSTGIISEAHMNENLAKTTLATTKIDRTIVNEKIKLIDKAAAGELTKPKNEMADFGAITYASYIYDKEKKQYKEVLLNQYGDWSIENQSQEAKALFEWLKTIKVK